MQLRYFSKGRQVSISKVTTNEDIKYIQENDVGSEEFVKKLQEVESNCAVKTNYFFEESDTEEIQELTNKKIKECKSDYSSDSSLSKKDYYNYCTCFEKKWLSIFTDEDFDYFQKNEDLSDNFLEKQKDLQTFCLSELQLYKLFFNNFFNLRQNNLIEYKY